MLEASQEEWGMMEGDRYGAGRTGANFRLLLQRHNTGNGFLR